MVSYKLPLTLALSFLSAEEEEQLITRTNARQKTCEDCKTLDIGDSIFKNKAGDVSDEEVTGLYVEKNPKHMALKSSEKPQTRQTHQIHVLEKNVVAPSKRKGKGSWKWSWTRRADGK